MFCLFYIIIIIENCIITESLVETHIGSLIKNFKKSKPIFPKEIIIQRLEPISDAEVWFYLVGIISHIPR